jgi:hypothetical protein
MKTSTPKTKPAKAATKLPPNVLYLNLHREFFAAIAAGTKKTEYRRATEFWARKLEGRRYDQILFRNGYAPDAPQMHVEFKGVSREARHGATVFAIRLGRVLEIERWPV